MPEINNIHINHAYDEIDDLIGKPPGWLLHSGISMIAIVVVSIVSVAWYIQYPDKLISKGILTSENPPIEIVSNSSGYIEKIVVENNQHVGQKEHLIYIHNTTDQSQLDMLQLWIEEYEQVKDPRKYLDLKFIDELQLGSLQAGYASLQLKYNELKQTLRDGLVFQQINNLSREIDKIKELNASLEREKSIFRDELKLAKKDYERNVILFEEGVVSELDMEKAKSYLLQMDRQYEGMTNGIIQNNIRVENLLMEQLRLKEERFNTIKQIQFSIAEIITSLQYGMASWSHDYIIQAPLNGKVSIQPRVVVKKPVNVNDVVAYIIPEGSYTNYISAFFPVESIGKIEEGQKAIIKFDAYPHKEYGIIMSNVGSISSIPTEDEKLGQLYEIRIPVDAVLETDYGQRLSYKPFMQASVEVITKERSVLGRIFDQLIRLTQDLKKK